MLIPVCVAPASIAEMTQQQLDEPIECICGNQVPLKKCMAVWTTKDKGEPSWFPVCEFRCYTLHIAEGNS